VDPKKGIFDLGNLRKLFDDPENKIFGEYGAEISTPEMLSIITKREFCGSEDKGPGPPYSSWSEFHKQNGSEQGPNGLLRHKIDGSHCVGHGAGTWDLITGMFL
jgi:hypothetical protein